jgi:hypothetical protein
MAQTFEEKLGNLFFNSVCLLIITVFLCLVWRGLTHPFWRQP